MWLKLMSVFPHSDPANTKTFRWVCVFFTCSQSARQTEPTNMQADDERHTFKLPTPPHNGATASKRTWEYSVPELSIMGVEERQMPEMPNLESVLGNSLQSVRPKRNCCLFQVVTGHRLHICNWLLFICWSLCSHTKVYYPLVWGFQTCLKSMEEMPGNWLLHQVSWTGL